MMRVTIDGVAYVVTEPQCQKAFGLLPRLVQGLERFCNGHRIVAVSETSSLLSGLTPAKPRGRPKGTSTFDLKRAKDLRKRGQTYPEIAAELGCSSRTVIRKLKGTP